MDQVPLILSLKLALYGHTLLPLQPLNSMLVLQSHLQQVKQYYFPVEIKNISVHAATNAATAVSALVERATVQEQEEDIHSQLVTLSKQLTVVIQMVLEQTLNLPLQVVRR